MMKHPLHPSKITVDSDIPPLYTRGKQCHVTGKPSLTQSEVRKNQLNTQHLSLI